MVSKMLQTLGYVIFNPLPYFENINVGKIIITMIKLENISSTLITYIRTHSISASPLSLHILQIRGIVLLTLFCFQKSRSCRNQVTI